MMRIGTTFGVLSAILLVCSLEPTAAPEPAPISSLPSSAQPHTKRQGHRGTSLEDGRVLFIGGYMDDRGAELYDPPSGRWLKLDASQRGRTGTSAVTLLDGRVLLMNGFGQRDVNPHDDYWIPEPVAEVFDPSSLTFTTVSPPSVGMSAPQAVRLKDGRVLLWGCTDSEAAHVEVYEPSRDAWTVLASPPDCAASSKLVAMDEGAMLTAGFQKPNYIFDAAGGSWKTASMSPLRRQSKALRFPDNRVLILGRPSVLDQGPHAAVYDSTSDQWVPTGPLTRVFTDTINGDFTLVNHQGKALLLGGSLERPGRCTETVEALDLASLTWSATRPLSQPRGRHSVNVLPDRSLLIEGGYGTSPESGECRYLRGDFEIYTP